MRNSYSPYILGSAALLAALVVVVLLGSVF